MTIEKMRDLFELVQDHYNTAYYPDEEILTFLNAGQKNVFNKIVFYGDSQSEPDTVSGVRFVGKYDLDEQKMNILADLIKLDQTVAAVSGVVTFSAIEAVTSGTVAAIVDITDASENPIDVVRIGEHSDYKENYFSANDHVLARMGEGGVKIDGATTENFIVSVILEPAEMDLSTPVQPSLRGVHELIVIEALKLAGFALSDEVLMMIKE